MLDEINRATLVDRTRGLVLGLAVGEAVGRAGLRTDGPLPLGSAGQLAAFTIDGLIRSEVRFAHRGICHRPTVIWHAYSRWALLRDASSAAGRQAGERWGRQVEVWPDGWLAAVPGIAAPAPGAEHTLHALEGEGPGMGVVADADHDGWYALARVLPILTVRTASLAARVDLAVQVVELTHGSPELPIAVSAMGSVVDSLLVGIGIDEVETPGVVAQARDAAEEPGSAQILAGLAPDSSAASALRGALYCDLSFPDDATAMLDLAGRAPHPDSVCCLALALAGVRRGTDALPSGLLSRLDHADVLDRLARDLVTQMIDAPGGDESTPGTDPEWVERYPGW